MSFLSWFTGRLGQKVTPPAPTPVVTPPPAPPAPPVQTNETVIQLENYNRFLRKWKVMGVPFLSSGEVASSKLSKVYTCSKERITVLTGQLTITGTGAKGKHNPSITKFKANQVFKAGEVFTIECNLGPLAAPKTGSYDRVDYIVNTKELGNLIAVTVLVN